MFKSGAAIDQGSREGNLFNRDYVSLRQQLAECPIINGVLLENVPVVSGLNTVGHSLGRTPRGYVVAGRNADIRVWDDSPADTRLLYLSATGPALLTLWVF